MASESGPASGESSAAGHAGDRLQANHQGGQLPSRQEPPPQGEHRLRPALAPGGCEPCWARPPDLYVAGSSWCSDGTSASGRRGSQPEVDAMEPREALNGQKSPLEPQPNGTEESVRRRLIEALEEEPAELSLEREALLTRLARPRGLLGKLGFTTSTG